MKQGQGLPLNTIIIAIIVIVVLVVIILIFTGQLSGFQESTTNPCQQENGVCMQASLCSLNNGQTGSSAANTYCGDAAVICCRVGS